jgi:hypothetical protein
MQNAEYRIQNTDHRPRGQSLLEALLSIALGVILIGGSVGLIGVSLRTFNTAKQHLQANSLVRQTAEILISLTRDNWHNIYDLTPGIHYKLAKQNNTYAIQKGEEKIFDSQGLVSYWAMDEATSTTAYDNQSTNNGTLVNSPTWKSSSDCVSGSCLSFDGTDDYLQAGIVPIEGGDFSVEAWINPSDWGTREGDSPVYNGLIYLYHRGAWAGRKLYFMVRIVENVSLGDSGGWTYWAAVRSSTDFQDNTFYHVVGTKNGNNLAIYVNGVKERELNALSGYTVNYNYNTTVWVGKGPSGIFNGLIDEVRIYNRALSAEEIKTHYQAGLDKLGLVAYWAMDENGETTAYDNQSTNNGTLVNSPTWKSSSDCVSGSCLGLNGSNQYVDCGNDESLDITEAITVEAWIRPNVGTGQQGIIGTHAFNTAYSMYVRHAPGNDVAVMFTDLNGTRHYVIAGTLTYGEWYHLVGTFNGTVMKLYINSVETGQEQTDSATRNFQGVYIGYTQGIATPVYYNGLIDEVRIYNRALSAEEISQRYQASYTKYFTTNKVSRTSGSIDATYASSRDDPSTLKINSVIKYGRGLISQQTGGINNLTFYLTRSYNNQTFHQTDWSGGSGQTGPIPNPGNKFDTADSNINYASTTGSIYMTTATTTVASLTSSILDTGVSGGAGFNSLLWQGSLGSGGTVKFQIAFSNSSTGPWTYYGPSSTSDYYQPNPNVSIAFPTTGSSSPQNKRYIRYKVYLSTTGTSPTINDIIINWSP